MSNIDPNKWPNTYLFLSQWERERALAEACDVQRKYERDMERKRLTNWIARQVAK